MERIISINFQGRVIPIEESAYTELKQYIDSLRAHFAHEESSDEIINDIENRIAELLSEKLKQGAPCIVMADLNKVIDNIGRLEDIEAAEREEQGSAQNAASATNDARKRRHSGRPGGYTNERLYRNEDDKILAGVCSGIAVRTGIDPIVIRILFLLLLGGTIWIYLLLWIIVPSQSMQSNITRRLYRNPDNKMLAGVCGGLAAYLRIGTWAARAAFLVPVLFGVFSAGIHSFFWDVHWGMGPQVFTGSLGSTMLVLYIILWISLPYASSASDRLEMRGERIDMNSIKEASQARAAAPAPRRSGLGHALAMLLKGFFLLIAGSMALGLFGGLIGLVFAGSVAMPFTDFVLDGWWQYVVAWTGLALVLGIPFLALTTWVVRRLVGARSRHHYLGYMFGVLWVAGLVGVLVLTGLLVRNFSARASVDQPVAITQPSVKRLYINVGASPALWNKSRFSCLTEDDEWDAPFRLVSSDSLWLNSVRVKVLRSPDSLYHVYETQSSQANTSAAARSLASHINFRITQQDTVLSLPGGFAISKTDKFRNQRVVVVIEVPVGGTIKFNKEIAQYSWFDVNTDNRGNINHARYHNEHEYDSDNAYLMTPAGLEDPTDSVVNKNHYEEHF